MIRQLILPLIVLVFVGCQAGSSGSSGSSRSSESSSTGATRGSGATSGIGVTSGSGVTRGSGAEGVLIVELSREGLIIVDGKVFTKDELVGLAKKRGVKKAIVRAVDGVSVRRGAEVVSALESAGVEEVKVESKPQSKP